jgi:rhodanese-related sulfurtransferase
MEEKNGVLEVGLDEALDIVRKNNVKLIWLGSEPADYIAGLLDLKNGEIVGVNPNDLVGSREEAAKRRGAIMVCYHGNTSAVVARMMKQRYGVDSYSLKGGVTAVVGEIF